MPKQDPELVWAARVRQLPQNIQNVLESLPSDVQEVRGPEHVAWLADRVVYKLLSAEDYALWMAAYPGWDQGVDPIEG